MTLGRDFDASASGRPWTQPIGVTRATLPDRLTARKYRVTISGNEVGAMRRDADASGILIGKREAQGGLFRPRPDGFRLAFAAIALRYPT